MKCKLCQKVTQKLVKSHIIAQSIHALSARAEDPTTVLMLSNDSNEYPKKSRTGVYDRFVCHNCETIFQKWESHALEFLKQAYELSIPTQRTHIELSGYNYHELKLFFISILWKADASEHHVYRYVNVGEKHRHELARLLLTETPGNWQNYSVFIERFNSNKSYASIMRSPGKAKMEDAIKFYVFYMAAFKIYIKCDSRKVPEKYGKVFLKENQPLQIPLIPFEGSRDHQDLIKVISLTRKHYSR